MELILIILVIAILIIIANKKMNNLKKEQKPIKDRYIDKETVSKIKQNEKQQYIKKEKEEWVAKQKENKEKGNNYEILVSKFYEDLGYQVYQQGIVKNLKDGGIDIVAKKEDEILLIQCKNWDINNKYRIREKEIREFYGACNFYIEDENIDKTKAVCIYVVPDDELIPLKSKAMFKKYKNRCRYQIIKNRKGSD